MEARKIDASHGKLTADVRGEIENEDGVLVIKRIQVLFHLKAPAAVRETVERVHGFYAQKCPVYRSIHTAIAITTAYEITEA
ncbi:MAG: OsmC family protein [Acidobacteria bacterium]|nr:OsmC family protein [Acidobacteriota bacterium]MCA1609519.1 OsmC family protein [Acidobacteriota bacterium]